MNEFTEERIVDSGVETKETEGAPSADNRRSRLLSADNMAAGSVADWRCRRDGAGGGGGSPIFFVDGFAEGARRGANKLLRDRFQSTSYS